jgi:hypothetical protein
VQIMATCTYHGQNDKRRRLLYSGAPRLDSIANALAKNSVDCLVILLQEEFDIVSIAVEKGMSRNSVSF